MLSLVMSSASVVISIVAIVLNIRVMRKFKQLQEGRM